MNKLKKLRDLFAEEGVEGFIIPSQDEYLSEYAPDCFKRLEWLTGFTGSTGLAVVLKEKAAFFTDGRYRLQAKQQLDSNFEIHNITDITSKEWVAKNLGKGRIGYDPWLHTKKNIDDYKEHGIDVKPVGNFIDRIWHDKPDFPSDSVFIYDIIYSGQHTVNKIENVAIRIKEKKCDVLILTASDSICWLLNIRGNDIPHTPLILSYALVFPDGKVSLYADPKKFPDAVVSELESYIEILPVGELKKNIKDLAGKRVLIDPKAANSWFFNALEGVEIVEGDDPCQLPKACKNEVEVVGMKQAHVIDGVALTKFLCWLDKNVEKTEINELSAANKLEEFRRESDLLQDLSFPTISGYAVNAAVVHYHATEKTKLQLKPQGIYLVDSGGQYLGGTTDVTRTVTLGRPTEEQKKNFTLVLKGHIAIATAEFDRDKTGSDLDSLARQYLNSEGLDYDHGTGHGVGSYLGVHEGPQGISKKNQQVFYPGMVVSNEPGYYKEGEYGIRIENLVVVIAKGKKLGFETITMAPIDLTLVNSSLLTDKEKKWLNNYHLTVRKKISVFLDDETKKWLEEKTRPLD